MRLPNTLKNIPIIQVRLKEPTVADANDEKVKRMSSSTAEQFITTGKQLEYEGFKLAASCYLNIEKYIKTGKMSKYHVSKNFIDYLPKIEGDYLEGPNCLKAIKNSIVAVQDKDKDSFCKVAKAEQLDKAEVTELNKVKEEA